MKKRRSRSYGDSRVARSKEKFDIRSVDPFFPQNIKYADKSTEAFVAALITLIKNSPDFPDKKTFFLIRKLSKYSLGKLVENSHKKTIPDFIREIQTSLNKILQDLERSPFIKQIKKCNPLAWVKYPTGEYNLTAFIENFAPAEDYLNLSDKTEKLFQKDQFNRLIAITRLLYVYFIAKHVSGLYLKLYINPDDPTLWINSYKIGLLQGQLGLIASFSDPEIADIHFRGRSSRAVSTRWIDLNKLKQEAIKLADEQWKQEKNKDAFHTEMARDVFDKIKKGYPELVTKYRDQFTERNVRRMLIPTAKKYDRVFGYKGVKKEKESIP